MYKKVMSENQLSTAELISFKIMESAHIKSTISLGNIYFGCADRYAYLGSKGNKGQGDINEGLYARVKKSNTLYIQEQKRLHGNDLLIIPNQNKDFIDLKLNSVMNMGIYCFYSMNSSDRSVSSVDIQETPEFIYRIYSFPIPKNLFQDFSEKSSHFGIMNFLNHTDLYNRVEKALKKQGCHQLLESHIEYVDREDKEWFLPEEEQHPAELFYKDKSFSYQKEARIVVADDKFSFKQEKFRRNKCRPLNIGNVDKDIVMQEQIKITDLQMEIHQKLDKLKLFNLLGYR